MKKTLEDYNVIVARIESELIRTKVKNPSYSLRAFAKKVGLPASALSEVLRKKRPISLQMTKKIADALDIDVVERDQWFSLFQDKRAGKAWGSKYKKVILSEKQFSKVSDWHHFAILSLMETKSFRSDSKWIAKRLAIDIDIVAKSLSVMERLRMVEKDHLGNYRTLDFAFESTDGIESAAVKKFQHHTLRLADKSLTDTPVQDRNFYAISLAISMDKIPEARRRMREFLISFSEFLENDNKDEVYTFSMQLFPVSKREVL